MGILLAAAAIARKDLRIELRTGEIVVTTGLFALLVAVLTSLSFYVDEETSRRVAPGVLWITVAFSGVLAIGRTWARERENDVMRALLLAPISRAAIYLGKAASTLAFLVAVEIPLVAIVAVLFRVDLAPVLGPLVLLLLLGDIGFVAAGTLFGAMSVDTKARDLALSVALFPLVAPALLAGVVATRELFGGATLGDVLAWVRILLAFDIVIVVAGALLFEPLTAE